MNSRHILDALDAVDEQFLAEVDSIRSARPKNRHILYKLLATAACLCLICTGIWAISKSNQRDTPLIETQLAFLGRYYYFDSLKEVAAYCGMKESKLKSLLYRTRQNLRDYLIKEGFDL